MPGSWKIDRQSLNFSAELNSKSKKAVAGPSFVWWQCPSVGMLGAEKRPLQHMETFHRWVQLIFFCMDLRRTNRLFSNTDSLLFVPLCTMTTGCCSTGQSQCSQHGQRPSMSIRNHALLSVYATCRLTNIVIVIILD